MTTATRNRHGMLWLVLVAALLTVLITTVLSGMLHKHEPSQIDQQQYITAVRDAYDGQIIPINPISATKTDQELVTYGRTLCSRDNVLPQLQPILDAAHTYLC